MDWWEIQAKRSDFKRHFYLHIYKALRKMMLLCNSHALMSKLIQENQWTLLDLCVRESTPLNLFMVKWMTFCIEKLERETDILYFSEVNLHVLMYELDAKGKPPYRMIPNVKDDVDFSAMDPLPDQAMAILPGDRCLTRVFTRE